MTTILQIRLKGAHEGSFQNIEVPFNNMSEFQAALDDDQSVLGQKLYTTPVPGERKRMIIERSDLMVTRDGVDWAMTPTVEFCEAHENE